MKFSTAAVVAVLTHSASTFTNTADARHNNGRLLMKKRAPLLNKGLRSLWEEKEPKFYHHAEEEEETTTILPLWGESSKEDSASDLLLFNDDEGTVDVGILRFLEDGFDNDDGFNPTCSEGEVGFGNNPEQTCDCANFDASTATGSFTCTASTDFGGTVTYAYTDVVTETDGAVSGTVTLAYDGEPISYSYSVTYENSVATSCAGSLQDCKCGCTIGTCPDSTDVGPVSLSCPGLTVDLCEGGDPDVSKLEACDAGTAGDDSTASSGFAAGTLSGFIFAVIGVVMTSMAWDN